ncbi:hypothetical protein HZS_4566, partial [Henneguya salminicola]
MNVEEKKIAFLTKNFPDIAPDDIVINDFSCSLQKDTLVQGRIYLSSLGYYFYSKVFGYVNTVFSPWKDVCKLKKDNAAFFLPIVLHISTTTEQHTFQFWQNRNKIYAIIKVIWLNHQSSEPLTKYQLIKKAEEIIKLDDGQLSEELMHISEINNSMIQLNSITNLTGASVRACHSDSFPEYNDYNYKASFEGALNSMRNDQLNDKIVCACTNQGFNLVATKVFFFPYHLKLKATLESVKFLLFDGTSPIIPKLADVLGLQDIKVINNSGSENCLETKTLTYLYPVGFPFAPISTETVQEFYPAIIYTKRRLHQSKVVREVINKDQGIILEGDDSSMGNR